MYLLARHSRAIRILHAATAAAITFQLLISLVMDHPHATRPMSVVGRFYFQCHEWAGLLTAGILLSGWVYRLLNWRRESQGALYPWISVGGCKVVALELKTFLLLRWTKIPQSGALAGTAHGLGLLAASAMAATGVAIFIGLGSADQVTPGVHNLMEVHSTLATFMWIYLYGHALMALWHQFMGHRVFDEMFSFKQR
ncbi:MAG: cytochrome b/b6 domain-containing protein [Gammaproteobacteria bacterium]